MAHNALKSLVLSQYVSCLIELCPVSLCLILLHHVSLCLIVSCYVCPVSKHPYYKNCKGLITGHKSIQALAYSFCRCKDAPCSKNGSDNIKNLPSFFIIQMYTWFFNAYLNLKYRQHVIWLLRKYPFTLKRCSYS